MKRELVEQWQLNDKRILDMASQMTIIIQQRLAKRKNLPTKEIRDLAASLQELKRIQDNVRGDSAKSLLVLVSQGIVPVAAIPKILEAIEKSEAQINEGAAKALRGID